MQWKKAAVPSLLIFSLCIAGIFAVRKADAPPSGIPAGTADERAVYLFTQGWKAEEIAAEEVIIPKSTSVVYEAYAELQAAQALPLADYAGQRAQRYTYRLAQSEWYAELLCADGILIGAMCYEPDTGIMHQIHA